LVASTSALFLKARIDLLSFNTWLKDFTSYAIVKILIAFT
jgi:hypothetical protein